METKDILLYESGDGGEMSIQSNDLALAETLYMQVYLAMFGGNVEENTKTSYLNTEERFDWWGNTLFFDDVKSKQFNSNMERTLKNVSLNSSGRLEILRAMNEDLTYLTDVLDYEIDVELPDVNKIRLIVQFRQKGNQEDKILQLVYDNAKNEIIIEQII
ncbi:hypothetical protein D3C86_1058860 [compost metagenome]